MNVNYRERATQWHGAAGEVMWSIEDARSFLQRTFSMSRLISAYSGLGMGSLWPELWISQ